MARRLKKPPRRFMVCLFPDGCCFAFDEPRLRFNGIRRHGGIAEAAEHGFGGQFANPVKVLGYRGQLLIVWKLNTQAVEPDDAHLGRSAAA